jgi:hypothetical protein
LDLSNLPPQQQKLSVKQCGRIAERIAQLDQLPVHLKDLELDGFYNLVSLPSFPSGLLSLNLEHCHSLILPPILPGSLRKLSL